MVVLGGSKEALAIDSQDQSLASMWFCTLCFFFGFSHLISYSVLSIYIYILGKLYLYIELQISCMFFILDISKQTQ